MNFIERTTPDSIQAFCILQNGDDIKEKVLLIKDNILQRVLKSMSIQGISEEELRDSEFTSKILIRIGIINNTMSGQKILVGISNLPMSIDSDNVIIPTCLKQSLSLEEYPSDKLLSNKLNELVYSDFSNPLDIDFLYGDIIEESDIFAENVNYSDLNTHVSNFYESLYSYTKVTWEEKLSASYILSIDKSVRSGAISLPMSDLLIDKIVSNIEDVKLRTSVGERIKKYSKAPEYLRGSIVAEAEKTSDATVNSSENKKPISSWKLLAITTVIVLSVLAIARRKQIATAYNVSKNAKDFNKSKFSVFMNSLFTREGSKNAKQYIQGSDLNISGSKTLDSLDYIRKQAVADKSKGDYIKNKASEYFKSKW